MDTARRSVRGSVLIGAVALLGGVVLGRVLPTRVASPLFVAGPPGAAPAGVPATFADIVEQAGPGVVTVRAQLRAGAGAEGEVAAEAANPTRPVFAPHPGYRNGSGFIVHERGLVVTSRHVVLGSQSIEVILHGLGSRAADLVGEDIATDLALLRLVEPPPGLTALTIGDSEDLRAGDWIVAVGNPFDFTRTVTAGVVSFVGRHLPHSDFGVTNDFLQFSAPVNPGSSGCPVLDLAGRVVGVTTQAAMAAQGISFAVPSRTLRWALEAMEAQPDGRVRRGYLGIEFASRRDLDEAGAPCQGAVIVRVVEGEPADLAGLRRGDLVLRVDGEPVADARVLHDRIVRGQPGGRINLELLRDGVLHDPIEAVLGEVGSSRPTARSN